MSSHSSIQNFLNHLNYDNICLLPFNNDPLKVAIHVRNNNTTINVKRLTGKDLLKWNVEREANRLQVDDPIIIDLATRDLWYLYYLTDFQRDQFTNLANTANSINQGYIQVNGDTYNRIFRMNFPQESDNSFVSNFFNGTNFSDNNDLEFLTPLLW